jgi:long-chain acyl-CoA synthetase
MLEQMGGLLLPLTIGASVVYPASRRPSLLLRDMQQQRITAILGVPQIFALFMQTIEQELQRRGKERVWRALQWAAPAIPMQVRRLIFRAVHERLGGGFDFLLSGGAPLDATLMRKWETLGVPMLQAYGTTEAAPALTATTLNDRPPGSVGKPLPGVRVRVAEDGEILAGGANITPGYWQDPEATAAAFVHGWYRTGDLGYLDKRGHLFLRGRKKDLIVRPDGQNVYPEDVERELLAVPGVEEAVAIERAGTHGAEVHAVLRCAGSMEGAAALVRRANERLAPHQQIQGFTVWPHGDFPRTHTFKVRKGEIARILTTGEAPAESPALPTPGASPVLRLVMSISSWPAAALHESSTLGEIGIDSLGRAELLAAIEHECGIYLDEATIGPETSIGELEQLIKDAQSGARPLPARWPLSRAAVRARDRLHGPAQRTLDIICPGEIEGRLSLTGVRHPAIFVANHSSGLDVHLMLRALGPYWRRRIAVVTADKYFVHPMIGACMSLFFNSFRFVREGSIRPTLEHAAWLVDQRWSLILFPEGTRSVGGAMAPFKAGIGMLAVELGIPVIPLHIDGAWEVLPRHRRLPRPGRVHVRIGEPLRFAAGTGYSEATRIIEAAVVGMAPVR